ncbi:hypothetical protein TraAM80_05119 [Trypanosoma rangeli]|uniref:Uncharacterized protein n=1 Tax=Trypanosoma rangeli TaxID=5698 RepID=A0A3S5IR52_TRYRA|nr:uncharacterized protein TraAM80_05119 [Trypanosoma rangeli]RNF04472.1 hypothetical protein TraAM80_05119 [Trypanosoma rangeli]|eukprot:RNF04472.1 hypothetical protein TraAM80_05119 [Trypanosoma rangeli]
MWLLWLSRSISTCLRESPWRSNVCIGVVIGFTADVLTQIVVRRPPSPRDRPQTQSSSPLVIVCPNFFHRLVTHLRAETDTSAPVIDLRRSFIFCSFTIVFNTFFFLSLYRRLDALYPPASVTRGQALLKGFLSWVAANTTTPLYFSYVATLSHYFIYHTGRHCLCAAEGDNFGWHVDFPVFWKGVKKQIHRQLREDWPDTIKYGFVFWGANWMPMFYYISPHFRYVYTSCLQVAWGAIMSHLMHRRLGVSQAIIGISSM